ncbi:flavin-containing monooxygenase [Hoyosella altamirensis]|uniref:Putative flavoprotein involved in K+ transport n=1 Tax=Hoyosella altamirensis TaxID=616997 RepID=A0A839RNX7_9ACTN|nr:NAD(P)/FAD-dependent oxidoreductase [Hoyosella altamirensis]MBB3038009.1 putative flavoprotein involved in K+ transport [Hoyosella altamirensis]
MTHYDAIVIGGGQSGLAAAYHLRRRGLDTAIIEAGSEPVGSWPNYYDSLTLFSPARYSSLPGLSFGGDGDRYPRRDEVVDYLRRYAKNLDADIHVNERADTVFTNGAEYIVRTDTGASFTAPRIIAATGGFGTPHIPDIEGLNTFTGAVVHAADYRAPTEFAGQNVIVVGAGNSAVQIAAELAETADVILASRKPVRFVRQRPLRRDMHFWFKYTGIDTLPIGHLLSRPPTSPVFDTGRYRAALTADKPQRRAMFTKLEKSQAFWPDRTVTTVDSIILATGYTPNLKYLEQVGALTENGYARHKKGLSTTHPGLGYVGLEWQRSLSSASLRGVGRDANYVVRRLKPA